MLGDAAGFLLHTRFGNVLLGLLALILAKYVLDAVGHVNRIVLGRPRPGVALVFGDHRVGLTVNTVVLSVVRYVAYFLLLGWILRQFGVQPTQYLASVSFVAIAVGFGTQGLVQDVVTGFFLIFEHQLDVGDMVVINGITGLVEDFGLRLTRLRLADGASVVIPNRSIGVITNYRTSGLTASLDVTFGAGLSPARRDAACAAAAACAQRLAAQFSGAVRGAVQVVAPGTDGPGFLRLRLPLWPGQTWVVDAVWVPRVQADVAASGLEATGFSVIAHYDQGAPPPAGPGSQPHWPGLPHLPRRPGTGAPKG